MKKIKESIAYVFSRKYNVHISDVEISNITKNRAGTAYFVEYSVLGHYDGDILFVNTYYIDNSTIINSAKVLNVFKNDRYQKLYLIELNNELVK